MTKPIIVIRLAIAGLMILIGTLIYLTSRSNVIFLEGVSPEMLDFFGQAGIDSSSTLGHFVVYNLPDGLWFGALLIFQQTFLGDSVWSKLIFYGSALTPFVWELLQMSDSVPGGYDPYDLATYLAVLLLFMMIRF